MGRTIIVGDIHGMLSELIQLIAKVGLARADTLVSVGDLLDKGPDSNGVVRYLRELRQEGFKVVLVLGNHEEKHAIFRYARTKNPKSNMKGADKMATITDALTSEDLAFLESAVLCHRLPEHNALVVHAGVTPAMTELPTDGVLAANKQVGLKAWGEVFRVWRDILRVRHITGATPTKLTLELEFEGEIFSEEGHPLTYGLGELPVVQETLVRKKIVKPRGSFVQLGAEEPGDVFWADTYDGRFGHLYFGHNPFLEPEPKRFPFATGLDLGCVFGGHLAAAVLEVGKEPSFVTVKAAAKYANGFWEDDV